jgi:hypothetical protein
MNTRHLLITLAFGAACYRSAASSDTTAATSPAARTPIVADSGQRSDSVPRDTTAAATLQLTTDKSRYRPGDAMTLTLSNRTGNSYTYNPCTRIVERESGSSWTPVLEQRMCTMIAHVLSPRSTRTETTDLPTGLQPGRYRVAIVLSASAPGGESRSVRAISAPFDVGG